MGGVRPKRGQPEPGPFAKLFPMLVVRFIEETLRLRRDGCHRSTHHRRLISQVRTRSTASPFKTPQECPVYSSDLGPNTLAGSARVRSHVPMAAGKSTTSSGTLAAYKITGERMGARLMVLNR